MYVVQGEGMLDKDDALLDDELSASEIFDNESSRARYSHSARKKLEEHMEMMRLRRLLDDYYYEEE
ncbi:PA3496 family putative envelope integrity protein [Thiohalophilus sp.]|uniref:PA3496 family putative envelope integrity protein n=1 Tax=Thiohalophilus sp. TaxID=3028392 RepID=UPI003975EDDA